MAMHAGRTWAAAVVNACAGTTIQRSRLWRMDGGASRCKKRGPLESTAQTIRAARFSFRCMRAFGIGAPRAGRRMGKACCCVCCSSSSQALAFRRWWICIQPGKSELRHGIDSIRELASWPKVPVERQIRQAPQRLPDGPVPSSGRRAARADSYERGERNSGDISQQMRDAFARKRRAQRLKIMPNSLLRTVSPNPNTQATTINKQTNKQINKQIYATSSESVSHPAQNPHSLSPNLSPRSADPC